MPVNAAQVLDEEAVRRTVTPSGRSFPARQQRVDEFRDKAGGHRCVRSIARWPLFCRQMQGSEYPVHPWQHRCIVLVDRVVVGVVLMMETRRGNQPLQGAEAPLEVG